MFDAYSATDYEYHHFCANLFTHEDTYSHLPTLSALMSGINMYSKIKKVMRKKYRKMRIFLQYELKDIQDSYFSGSTKSKTTPFGFKMLGSSSVHHIAMQNGTFEPEETTLLKEQFHRADIFVDVGSNIGFYACLARSMGLHVIAVEPLPKNQKHLLANLLMNNWKDTEVFPLGLGESPGVSILYGASSTGASLIKGWAGASRFFHRAIALSTLDIILGKRFAGKKIFIKIDVEGFEYPVLKGAVGVMQIQPKPTWIVEVCFNNFHPDNVNKDFKNVFDLFWQYGYEVRTADKNNTLIQPEDIERWVEIGKCDSGTWNYKFSPK